MRVSDLNIAQGAMLVAMGVKTFTWDPATKGNDIDVLIKMCKGGISWRTEV